ncbi:DNA-processing protein DprA [Haloferula rosea]|uniref:DNA-protecting protein DprA n=1 Tax=Haloferula rosea TaxID=490093 RepID=A0A934VG87_9BACT|nr:DNA-processing protein DprA [Haloferula rosea]MBK1827360.1 DNA-protecting protein DprA [Haloferula rosea]
MEISPNTQAILLLTAPLIAGKKAEPAPLLTLKDYNCFARCLRDAGKEPADLLGADVGELLDSCGARYGRERLEALLARGFLLGQAADRWRSRGIWVISRADACYPRRLKARLREAAPPILYGCGEPGLLDAGGLAVVGSRHVDDELVRYTTQLGAVAAEAGVAIVSGAARGIDSSAMAGALDAGGRVIGVMADSLQRAALAKGNRDAFRDGRLVVVSAYDPAAGFNVGHAMQRNKAIYALSDAGLVVTSDFKKGGTWAGAIEQLGKLKLVPVFVRNGSAAGKGNQALLQQGGEAWPEPATGEELTEAICRAKEDRAKEPKQESLGLPLREEEGNYAAESPSDVEEPEARRSRRSPSEQLMSAVTAIMLEILYEPMSDKQIAELLNVSKAQVQTWLKVLMEQGKLEKLTKPVRYQVVNAEGKLL